MIQYVMQILMENLCTKFHFIKDNRITEISCYKVTLAPPFDKILLNVTHLFNVTLCTTFPIQFSIEELLPFKFIRPHLQKFGNQLLTNCKWDPKTNEYVSFSVLKIWYVLGLVKIRWNMCQQRQKMCFSKIQNGEKKI